MPYVPVPNKQIAAAPADAKLWRYLSFARFASTLAEGQLFFPRATHLGDPFEGTRAKPDIDSVRRLFDQLTPGDFDRERLYEFVRDTPAILRPFHFVSCWSENPDESAALWSYYTRGSETVAMQATFGSLCDSLRPEPKRVEIGRVRYIDFMRETAGGENYDSFRYFAKRRLFSFEREVRAVVLDVSFARSDSDSSFGATFGAIDDPLPRSTGKYMQVDLATLIEAVYVAPDSTPSSEGRVRSILEAHGLKAVSVRRSSLADSPLVYDGFPGQWAPETIGSGLS